MPIGEYAAKEALRAANDWLVMNRPPGSMAAQEGIANVIPLVMIGEVDPDDLDQLAAIVEENGREMRDPTVSPEEHLTQLKAAVRAAFDHVKGN